MVYDGTREKNIVNRVLNFPAVILGTAYMDYVEKFLYLGSYMSSDGDTEPDVCSVKIGKAAYIFQRLRPI